MPLTAQPGTETRPPAALIWRLFFHASATLLGALLARADGIVTPQFGAATNFPAGHAYSLVVVDFNRDGKNDVAVAVGANVNLLLGLGGGRLATPATYYVQGAGVVGAADFNRDGRLDILSVGSYGGSVLLSDGFGGFTRTNFDSSYANWPNGVAVADFNGDAIPDMAVADSRINVAFGRGDGSFAPPTRYAIDDRACDILAGDLNGDGRPDLAIPLRYYQASSSNIVCILLNTGNGTFAAPRYCVGNTPGDGHSTLALGDFNNDGKLDMAVLNGKATSVTIWLNQGGGTFLATSEYGLGFAAFSLAAGDLNGDGALDLVARGSATARVLVGHGDGSFTLGPAIATTATTSTGHSTIALADLNGDLAQDIVLANPDNNSVAVMLNQTPPTLAITRMAGYNQITWLVAFGMGFQLECTTNPFLPGAWEQFPYPPVVIGSAKGVADWADCARKFYRLRKP